MSNHFLLGAELGDSVYALPTIKSLGGGVLWAVERPWCRPDWVTRVGAAKRLFESQDYVTSLKTGQPLGYTHDLTTYRTFPGKAGDTIASRIARWVGASPDLSQPWLTVNPSPLTRGRIIVSRGPRWRGIGFPWQQIVKTFQSDILFIGLDSEYQEFTQQFGHVERYHTNDLLDAAEAIAGSELFIGSQSSPNAVCEGLKHTSVLEICPTSIDCIYDRSTSKYCVDGQLEFEALGKKFSSPSHHEQTNYRFNWSLLLNNKILKHQDFHTLQFMGRAQSRVDGNILPLDTIKTMIEQHSNRLAPC